MFLFCFPKKSLPMQACHPEGLQLKSKTRPTGRVFSNSNAAIYASAVTSGNFSFTFANARVSSSSISFSSTFRAIAISLTKR